MPLCTNGDSLVYRLSAKKHMRQVVWAGTRRCRLVCCAGPRAARGSRLRRGFVATACVAVVQLRSPLRRLGAIVKGNRACTSKDQADGIGSTDMSLFSSTQWTIPTQ